MRGCANTTCRMAPRAQLLQSKRATQTAQERCTEHGEPRGVPKASGVPCAAMSCTLEQVGKLLRRLSGLRCGYSSDEYGSSNEGDGSGAKVADAVTRYRGPMK